MYFVSHQGCSGKDRDSIALVYKDGKLLDNRVSVLHSTTLSPRIEVQVCCRLISEPSRPVGLVENCIRGSTRVVAAAQSQKL